MRITFVGVAASVALLVLPVSAVAMEDAVDDASFNAMLGTLGARDTGSRQFDMYVALLNQELAHRWGSEAYGAAGPSGPLDGFDGYVAGFLAPDTGSVWFNDYVDMVNVLIQSKQSYQ